MFMQIKLPSNRLLVDSGLINVDLEWEGKHHYALTSGSQSHYEQIVASIVDDLIQKPSSVYQLGMGDLYYIFMLQRATSISDTYEFSWECTLPVNPKTKKYETKEKPGFVRCGNKNVGKLILPEMRIIQIPDGFVYPTKDITDKATGKTCQVSVKLLNLREEFDILERFYDDGLDYETITQTRAVDYAWERMISALVINDAETLQRLLVLGIDEQRVFKRHLLEAAPFKTLSDIMKDLEYLNTVGPDMVSPLKFKCSQCGGVSPVRIPFSADFILH